MTKYHFQSELDNLDNETIKAVEAYTEIFFADWFLYKRAEEFESLTDDTLKETGEEGSPSLGKDDRTDDSTKMD